MAPGPAHAAVIALWPVEALELIPSLTKSSSLMTVCTLVVSVEGMEAVGSRVLCVSNDQTSGCSLQAALTS